MRYNRSLTLLIQRVKLVILLVVVNKLADILVRYYMNPDNDSVIKTTKI